MRGDGPSRFCDRCNLHVHNLSGMTRDEAEELIRAREGRLCARIYRRFDGTVMTVDCGRRRIPAHLKFAAAALALLAPVAMAVVSEDFRYALARLLPDPVADAIAPPQHVMGIGHAR